MAQRVGFELLLVGVDDLAAAILALEGVLAMWLSTWFLFIKPCYGSMGMWCSSLEVTYNGGWLRCLDRQAVGLDWCTGAGLVSFLVLALDLCSCKLLSAL